MIIEFIHITLKAIPIIISRYINKYNSMNKIYDKYNVHKRYRLFIQFIIKRSKFNKINNQK